MDHPIARTRELDGLRVDEHPRPDADDRVVAELRAEFGEAHEPTHLHGIGRLLLGAAHRAAADTGVDVRAAVTIERSALRFEGRPAQVAAALGAATAELAAPTAEHLTAARAALAGTQPEVTHGAFARYRRYGGAGYGLTPVVFHGLAGATDDDVRRWASHWHGGTVHLTAVGQVPDFAQHLPTTGPTPRDVDVISTRTVPGTASWATPVVALSWLAGSLPADRSVAVVAVERLRRELPATTTIVTEVELLQPGTQHVVVAIGVSTDEEGDRVAATAVDVLDRLAADGPSAAELADASDDSAPVDLTPAAVAAAATRARAELLVLLPGEPRSLGDLLVATVRDPARLEGDAVATLRPAVWTHDRRSRLELHPDGLRLDRADLRVVVDRATAVALLRHADGTRTVVLRDGRELTVDPATWNQGGRAVEHVDEVFDHVAVEAPPAGPPSPQLVAAARSPRWLVALVAAIVLLPIGAAITVLAFGAPLPGRLVLVPLAAGLTLGTAWLALRFARERFAAVAALRDRDAAGHQVRS